MSHLLTLLILVSPASFQGDKEEDREVSEAIETFKEVYFSPRSKEKDRVSAVKRVASLKADKTLLACAVGLKDFSSVVRVEAARQIGGFDKVPKASKHLFRALDDRSNAKRPKVRQEIVKSLGRLKERAALPALHSLFDKRDFPLARQAVIAASQIRDKSSISRLIKLLKKAEKDPESLPDASDPTGSVEGVEGYDLGSEKGQINEGARKEQQDRKRYLHDATLQALKDMTGERFNIAREWDAWWRKHGGSFRIEK